jgi:hypothetical protein
MADIAWSPELVAWSLGGQTHWFLEAGRQQAQAVRCGSKQRVHERPAMSELFGVCCLK